MTQTKTFYVVERITIEVCHYVQADDEQNARELVSMRGYTEYDDFVSGVSSDTIHIHECEEA